MSELEQTLGASVDKAKNERRSGASPSIAFHRERSRCMADDVPSSPSNRIYHHLGHVCLDKDPTALVMVMPFAFANKVRS
jgi:hypothetical protein